MWGDQSIEAADRSDGGGDGGVAEVGTGGGMGIVPSTNLPTWYGECPWRGAIRPFWNTSDHPAPATTPYSLLPRETAPGMGFAPDSGGPSLMERRKSSCVTL